MSLIHINFFLAIDYSSVCKVQNLSCKITVPESQTITDTGVTTLQENRESKKGKIIKTDFLG